MKKKKKILCTHPAVSRLVHVTLDLACVRHQVFHSPVLQCCGVRGGEYGLYTEGDEWKMIKNLICLWQKPQYYFSIFIFFFIDQTHSLCTRWVRRSWVTCSCQAFLTPLAERGVAAGRFANPPPTDPSGISWLETEMKRATDIQSHIYKRMITKIDIVGFKDELICQVSAILVFSHFSNCKTQHQEAGQLFNHKIQYRQCHIFKKNIFMHV